MLLLVCFTRYCCWSILMGKYKQFTCDKSVSPPPRAHTCVSVWSSRRGLHMYTTGRFHGAHPQLYFPQLCDELNIKFRKVVVVFYDPCFCKLFRVFVRIWCDICKKHAGWNLCRWSISRAPSISTRVKVICLVSWWARTFSQHCAMSTCMYYPQKLKPTNSLNDRLGK